MKKIVIAILATALLALSACGSVDNGVVTEKRYTPAKEWWEDQDITEEQCGNETKTTYDPIKKKNVTKTVWDCDDVVVGSEKVRKTAPAKYELLLRQDDGDTGTVTVSESVYNATKEGDYYGERD